MEPVDATREPGWYAHPNDPIRTERWWDGLAWTDLTRDIEPEHVTVKGKPHNTITFTAQQRPLLGTAAESHILPTGSPRTDGSEMALPAELRPKQTKRRKQRETVTHAPSVMQGPVNPKLRPAEPHDANPDSIVVRSAQLAQTSISNEDVKYTKDLRKLKSAIGACVALVAVVMIFVTFPKLGKGNNVENAFEPLQREYLAPATPADANPPLGEVVERTDTPAITLPAKRALPSLKAADGKLVFVDDDNTFTMLIEASFVRQPDRSDNVYQWITGDDEVASDTLTLTIAQRDPSATATQVLVEYIAQLDSSDLAIESQVALRPDDRDSQIIFVGPRGEAPNGIDAVVIGPTTIGVLRWTAFDNQRYLTQRPTMQQLLSTGIAA